MPKYRAFSRRVLRARFRTWARGNWKAILLLAIGALALIGVATYLILGVGERPVWKWYVLGALHVVVAAAFLIARLGLPSSHMTVRRSSTCAERGARRLRVAN